jgi:hypothetical protein
MVYWPTLMQNFGGQPEFASNAINLVIRSDGAGRESLLGGVRKAVWLINPRMPGVPRPDDEGCLRPVDGADVVRAGHARRAAAVDPAETLTAE